MSAIFVKIPPAMRERRGAERLADREADEAGSGQAQPGTNSRIAEHQQQPRR